MNTELKSFHEAKVGDLFMFYRYPGMTFQKIGYDTARNVATGLHIDMYITNSVSVIIP